MRRFVLAVLAAFGAATASRVTVSNSLRGVLPGMLGWSAPGHEITGAIAAALLNSGATAEVANILPAGSTLESVGPWADTIRSNKAYSWANNLHFIDTPNWACKFTESTDCPNNVCLYAAILNYTQRITTQTGTQQNEALKFLTHFLGDIHQPLHVSFASDLGGNTLTGTFLGESGNLHHFWDYSFVNTRITRDFDDDQDSYIQYLVDMINGDWAVQAKSWGSCVTPNDPACVQQWADETAALACQYAYKDQNGNKIAKGFSLGEAYYQFGLPIVEQQLAKGGIRLAGLLNNLFASVSAKKPVTIIEADLVANA